MDRTTSMATFVRVVDAGGFASAGRALGMSPSTVTEHVHALEARLGVRLLNRSTRKISLTEVGGAYYERSKQILADLDEADRIAHALHSSPRGTLRLNTSVAIPPFLAPVIAEYGDLHPDLSVNLSMTECMVDMVGEGFDLAVRDSPVVDLSLIARRVATYRFVVCGAPSYLKRRGTPKRPADLLQHNCLGCSHSARGDEWRFAEPDGAQSVALTGNLQSRGVSPGRARHQRDLSASPACAGQSAQLHRSEDQILSRASNLGAAVQSAGDRSATAVTRGASDRHGAPVRVFPHHIEPG